MSTDTVLHISSNSALQEVAAKASNKGLQDHHDAYKRKGLPLRVGTRGSPLALVQTRNFLTRLTQFCPLLRELGAFQEFQIKTSGDKIQDRRLADIGGKGLFSKEIHEQLSAGNIDFAVHSLKDLETTLPDGLVLACTLKRQDARDALIVNAKYRPVDADYPFDCLPQGAKIGTSSVRRQAQLLHVRPDLEIALLRGNVQSRLDQVAANKYDATFLAAAGLQRLGMEDRIDVLLDPSVMVPAAGQGIVGVTVREADVELREMLSAIEDKEAKAVATAERALLAELDGSCRTPIGGYAQLMPVVAGGEPELHLVGLVASEDGTFLLKKEISGLPADAELLGRELGKELRKDSPADIFNE
ncbi:Porphobilinogen deaminase (HemC) (PDB:1AH5) [Commensalibacter communis]|uniref:Porphobilinogen deaminase n=1 Tax=Commensalibacter communis TaxID=2972786 RepID=A0A9W4X6U3_9PROT|nr:hydroxymethylbilane synthase [Commensalibacter communis]CAI3922670.1 Porphobilinogen deaminase (HemC) (PDB:1AH5) [Commensalibacter communis]CAI3923059.1 Porphobilinogen deaminase (HemC) (PDB:1AH5) [Commensalibacter communis]CAI3944863.1 Porphobilinogen deaminase (HemC) (PDB:1AH5) [Commensalibacter communis]CAI3946297.1 Porphobilinogen deaminase (HemC) (PDB:1AH5) [Commensalibacter communis]CAI3947596.1 Porphobilinogen deaminase (HemC) (PDB:1AH5) [Commensalibacter communis]